MRKLFLLILISCSFIMKAQDNFDLSTLRIGPFHLKMDISEADKIAGKKLKNNDSYDGDKVNYKGEIIEVYVDTFYDDQNKQSRSIGSFSTKSIKFRTKSGLGVGSTKDQLIDAYRNFPSFAIYPNWGDNGKPLKNESTFTLSDVDAGTQLSFKLVNNVVTQVTVYSLEDGC